MKLEDIPKNKQPFSPPEGYFDTLPQRVARRVRKPENSTAVFWQSLRLAYVLPAMLVLLFAGIFWYNTTPQAAQDLAWQSVEEILLENDISEAELLDYYSLQIATDDNELTLDELLYDLTEEDFDEFIY
ncbi:hypothetical protein [Rhodoflexus sp.]